MSCLCEVHFTCASKDEALKIAEGLLDLKLAACAQIIENVESLFYWEGKLEKATECKVVFKSLSNKFSSIQSYIITNCSYQTPEISLIEIKESSQSYLEWVSNYFNS